MQTRATNFDEKVWNACAGIPRGRITTYKLLAQAIGAPKAARAVANSLGRNPHAPRVPCHRVVKSNGSLGGYSAKGGIARKRQLLESEGVKTSKRRIIAFEEKLFRFPKS